MKDLPHCSLPLARRRCVNGAPAGPMFAQPKPRRGHAKHEARTGRGVNSLAFQDQKKDGP